MDHASWLEALQRCARAVAEEKEPAAALAAIGETMNALIGSRMFTFLRFDLDQFEMERLYCTRPELYPIGARKAMRRGPWFETVSDRGETFIVSGDAQMRATFADYAALKDMGCTASMNVPVRFRGVTLGTMNLNGDEGRYDTRVAALAMPFAALAVPAYLTIGG